MAAEKVVPQTWWRRSFSEAALLLTPTNKDFPRRMFDIKVLSNKKLRNIYECVTRQQFIRKSLDFAVNSHRNASSTDEEGGPKKAAPCVAMTESVVQRFHSLWSAAREDLEGSFSFSAPTGEVRSPPLRVWLPRTESTGQLLVAAQEVLEYFYRMHGGIWTGCFAMEKNADCRGALAGTLFAVVRIA